MISDWTGKFCERKSKRRTNTTNFLVIAAKREKIKKVRWNRHARLKRSGIISWDCCDVFVFFFRTLNWPAELKQFEFNAHFRISWWPHRRIVRPRGRLWVAANLTASVKMTCGIRQLSVTTIISWHGRSTVSRKGLSSTCHFAIYVIASGNGVYVDSQPVSIEKQQYNISENNSAVNNNISQANIYN